MKEGHRKTMNNEQLQPELLPPASAGGKEGIPCFWGFSPHLLSGLKPYSYPSAEADGNNVSAEKTLISKSALSSAWHPCPPLFPYCPVKNKGIRENTGGALPATKGTFLVMNYEL